MSEPDNIFLIYLRRLDEKMDRPVDDMRGVNARVREIEERLARIDLAETSH
jgi:hypothetical protein